MRLFTTATTISQINPLSAAEVKSRNLVTNPTNIGSPASENMADAITIARNGDRDARPA